MSESEPVLLSDEEARQVGLAYAKILFPRVSESAQVTAVDRMVSALLVPTVANAKRLTHYRLLDELPLEGLARRAGEPPLLSIDELGGWGHEDRDGGEPGLLSDPSAVGSFEACEVDMILHRCFVAGRKWLGERYSEIVKSTRAGTSHVFQERRAAAGTQAVEWCCASATARSWWVESEKDLVFRAMQTTDPQRWGAYPSRMPTHPETKLYGLTPASDWQALNVRFIPKIVNDIRAALQASYGRYGP